MSALRMARQDSTVDGITATTASDAEAALLRSVASGDAIAFRTLVASHLGPTIGLARRLLGNVHDAEDVAQEAMLRLWRNAATLELGPGGIKPWLRRVTTNLVIDRVRAGRLTTTVAEMPEQPVAASQSVDLENRDLRARVSSALTALPERQRLALQMFHFEGMSQIEVGAALGVTDEAVESLLARARRTLKHSLKDEWQELLPEHPD